MKQVLIQDEQIQNSVHMNNYTKTWKKSKDRVGDNLGENLILLSISKMLISRKARREQEWVIRT